MVQLDDSQQAFVESPIDSNIRLLAPAGCGKTLCLLHRCKFLAEQSPNRLPRFLIVTFTRAARDELRARINEDSQFESIRDRRVTQINTLNSWGFRRLKEVKYAAKTIKSSQYHAIMQNDLQRVWMNYDKIANAVRSGRNRAPRILLQMIDTFKSLCFDHTRIISFDAYLNHCNQLREQGLEKHLDEQLHQLIELDILERKVATLAFDVKHYEVYKSWYEFWREATENLRDISKFTFEGQKYFAYLDEREKLEQGVFLTGAVSYDHVLVDEFQDINPLDLALVRAIVSRRRSTLTIVGDDDQAIFEWRGASPHFILKPNTYIGAEFETTILEVNYRSPANIVSLSQKLISRNKFREPKHVVPSSSKTAIIVCLETKSLNDSIDYVHELIASTISQGMKPSQIALIGRLQSQIIPYQVSFASKGIPFCAAEDLNIFLSETFDRLLRLLEIKSRGSLNQRSVKVTNDIVAMCNYVKWFPLSKRDGNALRKWLLESRPKTIADAILRLADYRGELKRTPNLDGEISFSFSEALSLFLESETVSEALLSLSSHFIGLQKDFIKAEDDFFFKDPPFSQLAEYARSYGSDHDAFIEDIELAKETLPSIPPADTDYGDDLSKYPVHLMTATRAKGKEFDNVVLLDVHDLIWPNKHAESDKELEAERRLFYVAFTRAREQVTMLLRKGAVPSPYIKELGLTN